MISVEWPAHLPLVRGGGVSNTYITYVYMSKNFMPIHRW